jgi:hypothetical protein
MLDVCKAYTEENKDKEFLFMHCFQKIQGVKKWDKVCLTLEGANNAEDGPLPSSAASPGCSISDKKAKTERNEVSSLAGFDATIEKMVSSFSSNNKWRDERGNAMRMLCWTSKM